MEDEWKMHGRCMVDAWKMHGRCMEDEWKDCSVVRVKVV